LEETGWPVKIPRPERGSRSRIGNTHAPLSHALAAKRQERRARRKLRNFSKNRPETTNLNHQYAIRRVVIAVVLDAKWPVDITDNAEAGNRM
jgi:hypothetical protein